MMVYLPVSTEGPPVKILLDEQPPALIGGNERLLIVDDEYPVRSVLGLSLERLGYKVTLAASGTEALEIFTPGSFDLVILDMIMPDLSGREVFYELMRRDRKARVLISTAYSSDEIVKAILRDGGKGYIQKPFAIEELARRVRECIDQ
jgi:two-component system cell cycle sensor histidine kinase/response regulator CckA